MEQTTPELRSLTNPPNDGITALTYLNHNLLASTSWDGCLRVHDTSSLEPQTVTATPQVPLLTLAPKYSGSSSSVNNENVSNVLYVGCLDGTVRSFDVSSSTWNTLGSHNDNAGCSAVVEAGNGMVVSAGWDSTVRCWDVRSNTSTVLDLPGKAFSMDARENTVVVATSGRRLCIYDCRQMGQPISLVQDRESSLKYQTRTVRLFPDATGMAIGSIEGRVAIEYVDENAALALGRKKYAFKCHRVGETIYPVNSIAFHPTYGTFATGGCDGTVVIWDGLNKKRISSLPKFPTSIAAMVFSPDGSELAIASSYTFEEGERDHPRDELFVRKMLDSECKPKQK